MRGLKLFSKATHFAIICCFCLPFLKGCSGCGVSAKDNVAIEKAIADSTANYIISHATTNSTNLKSDTTQTTIVDTTAQVIPQEAERTNLEKFLAAILQPNGDFSGLGVIVFGMELNALPLFIGLLICLLFVLASLIISFRKKSTYKLIFIFSLIESFCLFLFYAMIIDHSDILYGYWVVCCLSVINSITAYVIWKKLRALQYRSDA